MKKLKLSAMLIIMSMIVFSACGGGGSDDPDDPNYTIEIRPVKGTFYLNCEYVFYARKENNSKHLDNIIWEVDDTSAAKINADGRLTPLKAGKFKVTGTTVEGEVGMAECTVSSVSVREVFESSSGSISSYLGDDTDVIIPASINGVGIIKIDEKAFYFLTGLKSVEISSGVTSIEEDAFSYCNSLVSINIPLSVTSIGYSAFNYCSSLESIDIPSGVLSIGHFAFQGCSSLEIINIPSGVTSILDNVFEKCSSLKSIEIPTGV
ncbi:MAG: leucine-rich repeat protein, partial [Spirochaetes bacterium]|nr:leucine-rich repeat protein [Spirochaetota bacterium]